MIQTQQLKWRKLRGTGEWHAGPFHVVDMGRGIGADKHAFIRIPRPNNVSKMIRLGCFKKTDEAKQFCEHIAWLITTATI